jgi:ribonuclease J
MQTNVRFYAGLKTIGGTIVEVKYDRYRLLFDMGKVFDPGHEEIRPDVPWVFADAADAKEPSPYETVIAISHHHLDHTGLLPFIRDEIPVVMTKDTYAIMRLLHESGLGDAPPVLSNPLDDQVTYHHGPIKLTLYLVDHDIRGACGMCIETPDLKIVYSGDFRLHGLHPDRTLAFAQAARQFEPDLLLIEGTRADSEDNRDVLNEGEIAAFVQGLLLRQQRGAFFNGYPRNPERIVAFAQAARRTNRKLILHPAHAYVYSNFYAYLEDVYLWSPEYVDVNDHLITWLQHTNQKIVTPEEVARDFSLWFVEMPYEHFVLWDSLGDVSGSFYFASNGAPLGPFDPSYADFTHQLESRGISLMYAGSTGHASRQDIIQMATEIAPFVMMPLHSFKPWRIGSPSLKRIMPAYGQIYQREDLQSATYPKATDLL